MYGTASFYGKLTPHYHLIYQDWEASLQQQARDLDSIIREIWGTDARLILDAACGIGTQALGLAHLGYRVAGFDLSAAEIERARAEAAKRNLSVTFSVADMREVSTRFSERCDVVIACDNAVPHLLTDDDILKAFGQFRTCLREGGGCIVSVRDYEQEDLLSRQVKPYGIREADGVRWLLWQVWDPKPPHYDVTFYLVEDQGEAECRTHVMRSTYYAVAIVRLIELMKQAGFTGVRRVDGRFFQPLIVGTKQ